MDTLLFLPNLISPSKIKKLNLPLEFVAFGYTYGRLYRKNKSALMVELGKYPKGNSVVYGAIFLCKRFDYYNRVLDGMFGCSLSALHKNHEFDYCHRMEKEVTVIKFSSLEDLINLKYREAMFLKAWVYYANKKHKKYKTLTKPMNRITDGILAEDFKELYREVLSG